MAKETIDRLSWQPVRVPVKYTLQQALVQKGFASRGILIVDQYETMLEELFLLRNPRFRFDKDYGNEYAAFRKKHFAGKYPDQSGIWFYYPWLHTAIHFLPDAMHQELRTGRNRNLITKTEQDKFYGSCVAVLGMSVGSHVALTIAMTGGARNLKLADDDTISGSNLNRIRTGFSNIGLPKVMAVARQVYEMNPYAHIEIFPDGATEKNLPQILGGKYKPAVLIEETDNPYLKLYVRELARQQKIPIIMAADNDNGIIVDVERYDKKPTYPLLHGIMGKLTAADFKNLDPKNLPGVIAKMAGAQMSTVRMLASVGEVGKKLYSWPQLGNAATLCGSVLAFLARAIITGRPVMSQRTNFSPDEIFTPPSAAERKLRDSIVKKMGITK